MADERPPQTGASELHELLPWFVNGTLGATEEEAFRRHLEHCEDCRQAMKTFERLQDELGRHGRAFLEDHPSPETLVAFARDELDEDTSQIVDRHLTLCATCVKEMAWIRGEAVAEAPAESEEPRRRTRRTWAPWVAGLAAGLVGFMVATWLWNPGPGGAPAATDALPVRFLEGTVRAVSPTNVVDIPRGHERFLLAVRVDLPADAFPAHFAIVSRDGRAVRRGSVRADALAQDLVFIDCSRHDFPDGAYRLEITAAQVRPFYFDFRVRSASPDQ